MSMKKNKLISIGFLASFPIILSPALISCGNNSIENNEITLEEYKNKLNPTIKPEKESEKALTLASSITTEQDMQNWFNGLPQSQNGIEATFLYTSADDKKGILNIAYNLKKGDLVLRYEKAESGFKIREKTQDQIDVENYVKSLQDPTIKASKKDQQINTSADSIKTEQQVKEWFDGLDTWQTNAQAAGITISFLRTESNSNNSLINKGTLRVYYKIEKGDYFTNIYWDTAGFQIEKPPVNPPSPGYTKYKISFKRSNGKPVKSFYPTIEIYDASNPSTLVQEKWFMDDVNEFELPTKSYKCVIKSNLPNGMETNKEFIISEQNPSYDIVFTPKDLQNTPIPSGYRYSLNDVLYQSNYTDVKDVQVKLADNINNNKVTIFMFFKIDCPYCQAMEKEIAQWKKDPAIKDRFDIWLFSGLDSKDRLKTWSAGYPDFHVVYDANYVVRKQFDNTTSPQTGIPKFFFVDQQGVLVSQVDGQVPYLKNYLMELLN